ncbi:MAG: oligosaccharide flippase family protein [bacterium]|nr:oligosaccharide flippase family protein [bacterium]
MNLGKIQFLSVVTKGITRSLGIVQSLIIIRVLSATEFGIVGLVMAIGGLIGVSQHLGIVDGAIREIAVRKKKDEIGKVFWVSHIARQAVTLPLSLLLLTLAGVIATRIYGRPEIIPYIQLFAGVLVLQGLQDVLGATLTGMKKFSSLYIIQIITASVNILVFGYLTWKYHVPGFFWSVIITTLFMVALLSYIIRKELAGNLTLPTWKDVRTYGKNLLHIGTFMYVSRIFYVLWQKLPLLMLGGVLAGEQLGYLNVSLTFGSQLVILAAALSEVNLSWMSTLFANDKEEFSKIVTHNIRRVVVLMSGLTLGLIFFIPEILHYVIRKPEYFAAQPTIILLTLSFFLYSIMDIGTSSIFVAANRPKLRALIFGILVLISGAGSLWTYVQDGDATIAASTMLGGSIAAFLLMVGIAKRSFNLSIVPVRLIPLFLVIFGSSAWLFYAPSLALRILVGCVLLGYTLWELNATRNKPAASSEGIHIICFSGALYDLPAWTNRQHIMHEFSKDFPVLYVEPRVWIFRYIAANIFRPKNIFTFLKRLFSYEQKSKNLYIKSQWNLLPGSREFSWISKLNHKLNKNSVLYTAKTLGFMEGNTVMWIYDTEAAQYLPLFNKTTVVYDCVDNHAAQAGVNRNSKRVHKEEKAILKRSNLVTVTSKRLLKIKRKSAKNIHLVLNAGDVALYQQPVLDAAKNQAHEMLKSIPHPMIGSVGALDSYKYDFELLTQIAIEHAEWHFVFVGSPIVEQKTPALRALKKLPNVHMIGSIARAHVPAYVAYFDICLIPYKNNTYNEASFPLKFWEFMATGKPIVASGVPELAEYEPMIAYANSPKEFSKKVADILKINKAIDQKRIILAAQHGWEQRANKLKKLLLKTID